MPEPPSPWFAGRPGELLLYRANRRPIGEGTLLPEELPTDPFDHFIRVLAPGHEVVTGTAHKRVWRVGGLAIDKEARVLTGRLGWQPRVGEVVPDWSDDEKDWIAVTAKPREHKLIPFGFDGDTRLLSVLRESSTKPTTIAAVFEMILRENEAQLHKSTTEWSVEPILDSREFLEWLHSLDHVRFVSFTAKLPNPEPDEEFEKLWGRLERSHATEITESIKSDREEGLVQVEQDPELRQAIAMGRKGFARLRGGGRRGRTVTNFNQNEEVARERVPQLPGSWDEMRGLLREFLKDRARRFLEGAKAA